MKLKHPIFGPLIKEQEDIVYIVSDLHLNHDKEFLWKARSGFIDYNGNLIEFNSCKEYTEYIFNELKELAFRHKNNGKKAYLVSLGDNCFNDASAEMFTRFSALEFEKIYSLAGNHSSGINTIFGNTTNFEFNNFVLIGSNIPFRVRKDRFIQLSHFPIMDWDHNTYGVLCGHCHGGTEVLQEDNDSFGKIFDCGVDNAFRLKGRCYFTLEECLDIIRNKESFNKVQIHAKRKIEESFVDDPDDK